MVVVNEVYENMQLEKELRKNFAFIDNIGKVILRKHPISDKLDATIFLSNKSILFLAITGEGDITMGDIVRLAKKMNLTPELLFPPKDYPLYFEEFGVKEFRKKFPGKYLTSMDDIAYYRTLAPYSPALIQVLRVENGLINKLDTKGNIIDRVSYPYSRARKI